MRKHVMLLALILCLGIIQLSPAATWTIDKVTDNTEQDIYPFVTTVPSGLLTVYAHNDGDAEVFVANNFSGPWATSRVTDNTHNDLGLDIASRPGDDFVHISILWQDTPDDEISYCTGSPSLGWDIERVTDDSDDDSWPSVEVDANGYAHMVYQKMTGGDWEIFYANNVTGSWLSEQVTDNPTPDLYPWLTLDSGGNPHIVFINGGNLYHTEKTAGVWTTPEFIVGGFGVNSFPYLVLDNEDYAHICFAKSDGTDNEIYYANNVTGDWQESKVTTNDYNDLYPTLFVDPYKKIHIAYMAQEAADAEIFYANNVGGVWDIGRVTDNSVNDYAIFGRYFISDAQGFGHIFFWNNSDGDAEIYRARSNEPLFVVGVEEIPAVSSLTLETVGNLSATPTLNYSLPAGMQGKLTFYSVDGQAVETFALNSSHSTFTWNADKVSAGVYFARLVAGNESVTAKTILAR
jgi:hypothetical protein